ncbi:hypothetical protein AB6A40_002686 [Gnathostoma spinigerum]|uniref:small monomeric GTPase n=1 Tax=Gnathostoma spinigerum TaxID=75299 RepID=A0ABD6EH20_9BILA
MIRSPLTEMHVALIGMNGCGKSALAVKYIAGRFIGEYDPDLEDTYCRNDTILSQTVTIRLMDTVDGSGRDAMRYLAWADVYVLVYDITSQLSLQHAETTLQKISSHDHHLCTHEHKCILVGNKVDLERYRQVSESDGEKLAKRYGAMFAEISATDEVDRVSALIRRPIIAVLNERKKRRSLSPRHCASDSEIVSPGSKNSFSLSKSARQPFVRRRSKSPKVIDLTKLSPSKRAGSKLLKLFHN